MKVCASILTKATRFCLLAHLAAGCGAPQAGAVATAVPPDDTVYVPFKIDSSRLQRVQAIVYAQLTAVGMMGDKYLTDTVQVLKVVYNATAYHFGDTLTVTYYSFDPGVPAGKPCLLYLEPYPLGATHPDEHNAWNTWMLLDGTGKSGVQQ